ncbi:MAG TPA: LuxR C-terminal-related transcriptional regulator [Polyangiaceae bacterium]
MNLDEGALAPLLLARVGYATLLIGIPSAEGAADRTHLSHAERVVVAHAARGLSNRSIAVRRGTSVATVAKQLASAYGKLGISGRRELGARLS